jgi:hypothetical protein
VKAVFIFPHISLTAQELSGKLFGEIPRVTYPLKYEQNQCWYAFAAVLNLQNELCQLSTYSAQ